MMIINVFRTVHRLYHRDQREVLTEKSQRLFSVYLGVVLSSVIPVVDWISA